MKVAKWGNSLAVPLPAAVVEVLSLKEGDEIEMHVADRRCFEAHDAGLALAERYNLSVPLGGAGH